MASQFFQCPRCGVNNANGSRFCSGCGVAFTQPNVTPKRKNGLLGLWIVLGCLGLCVLCGGIGALTDKNKTSTNSNISTQSINANGQQTATVQATPLPTFAELKSKAQPLLTMNNGEHDGQDLKPFDEVLKPLRDIPKDSKDYKEAQKLIDQLIKKSSVIGAEILVLGPKPENSAYDGSVRPAEKYLKETLNDYDSSEYISWSTVTKVYIGKEPYWGTKVKLRAKNAFGAFIVREVVFLIRNNQVVRAEGL